MKDSGMRNASVLLLSGVLAVCCASPALAQAWLPPKGEAWFSAGYGNIFSTKHYFGTVNPGEGSTIDVGHTRGNSIAFQLGYALSDRFSFSVGLPYEIYKYYGPAPHPTVRDDGQYHGTWQDYHFNLAYQLVRGNAAVAPFVTVVIPSHDYEFFAHAAPGKDLREYRLGLAAGSRLDRLLADSYVEAGYSYAFVEKVQGVHHDRSDFGLELGYFLTPEMRARVLGSGYYTHGGLVFHTPFDLPPSLLPYHDQVGHSSQINVGGGLSYALSGSTEVYAIYAQSVYGRDGHKVDNGLNFGVTYSFSPSQLVRRYFSHKPAATP
jgi:opacity protein-like surface antigen